MTTARNIGVIVAIALVVAFFPHGGDAADIIGRVVQLALLGTLAMGAVWLYRTQRFNLTTLPNGLRTALYAGIAGLALAMVGYDWLTASSSRSVIFIVLVSASAGALIVVWQRSRELS